MAFVIVFTLLFLLLKDNVSCYRCERKPYGISAQPSPADGRFNLEIAGEHTAYLPDQLYILQIVATDGMSRFIGFMISAEGELQSDPRNPRRMTQLYPGEVSPQSHTTAKFSGRCLYSVEQAAYNFKESVEVYWRAPPSGSGCVTLRAIVVENENVWFEDGPPLVLHVCEDTTLPDDHDLQFNAACQICNEAKYEISFTGIWSRNTHPRYYPENDWITRYSDLVGASHNADFILWSPGAEVTDGLRQLAEEANTTTVEKQILEMIGNGTRTLIKGKGHAALKMNIPTYAFFRSDKENHLVSVAVGISPSPDWFLGVARFELCQPGDTWLEERELNLYPWDAGTDSGVSYESENSETTPHNPVSRVDMSSSESPFYETDIKTWHPFGKLNIKLVKTYERECEVTTEKTDEVTSDEKKGSEDYEENANQESDTSEPEEPSRYQNPELDSGVYGGPPTELDKESPEGCPMTKWSDWSTCEGICENGIVKGFKWRLRTHIPIDPRKAVSKYCLENYETFDNDVCEEECADENEPNLNAEKRVMSPILPGQPWSKKRDTKNT